MENVVTDTQVHEYSIMHRFLLTFLIWSLISLPKIYGQSSPTSKRARDFYEKAAKAWQGRQLSEAAILYNKVLEVEPSHAESHLRLAQIYELLRNPTLTKQHYARLVALQPTAAQSATAYHWLGKHFFQLEQYDSAQVYFQKALPLFPVKSSLSRLTEKSIASAAFAQQAIKSPLPIKKQSLGDTVNSLNSQYFPVLTADGETLIFSGLTDSRDENIYITQRQKKGWDVPEEISKSINTVNNEGTCSVSADGRTLVFTACNRQDGYGSCDLYITQKQGSDWSTPMNMGEPVNSRDWDSQPSLSADGHTLYFASDRRGGQGKKDIWVSVLDQKGKWSEPKSLGPTINTPDDENAPFIHANGRTLFYASNGLAGMGGMDIFITQKMDTVWAEPKNLGFPINTVSEQVGLFIASDGKMAYYSDDYAENGKSRSLLYQFELPESLKKSILPTRYAKGKVFDKKTGAALSSDIDLYDLKTQEKVASFTSDSKTGSFLAVLNNGSEYAFYVSKSNYLFKSLSFTVSDSASWVNLDIPLEAIEKDKTEILNNIFFQTGSFDLDEKSKVELDKLVDFLAKNPSIKIEISGHTDDVGSDKENLELSRKRALSVQEYLQKTGVPPARLSSKGFGESKPVAPNESESGRQKNRRIEWRIQ
ncbi:OmpA family protein [Dyadobacter sp. CY312]|uniref:OmpA family protein n=1 Tax=Dyadobacter sp. CY312 TaxID=2907303 RepID=UPI001F2CF2C4|nr:OmpA family protein [Dyadobacter sp. CY312]MCE7041397.1 OmpA family protein [Dyadobacter sp. CY312]